MNVFARDVLRDRCLFNYSRTYPIWALLSLLLPAVLGFAIGGTLAAAFSGFIFGGLARVFLANQAAWCVGSISHMIGSRPFATKDNSANNWPVAVFTFGEGLQNNHHAFRAPTGTRCGGGNQISVAGSSPFSPRQGSYGICVCRMTTRSTNVCDETN